MVWQSRRSHEITKKQCKYLEYLVTVCRLILALKGEEENTEQQSLRTL